MHSDELLEREMVERRERDLKIIGKHYCVGNLRTDFNGSIFDFDGGVFIISVNSEHQVTVLKKTYNGAMISSNSTAFLLGEVLTEYLQEKVRVIKDALALQTELSRAILHGYIKEVKRLLDNGADVNAVNELGNTALHFAVLQDEPVIVYLLLEAGADVSVKNKYGETPMGLGTSSETDFSQSTDKDYLRDVFTEMSRKDDNDEAS